MKVFVRRVVDKFIEGQIIGTDDRELYEFGIEQGVKFLSNILTTIGIGMIFGMALESMVFLLLYTPLRVYAGGFHTKTLIRCYLFSIFIVIVALHLIKLLNSNNLYISILLCISAVLLFILAPVENKAKPLSESEKHAYRVRTRCVLGAEIFLFVISYLLRVDFFEVIVCIAIAITALMVMGGAVSMFFSKNN